MVFDLLRRSVGGRWEYQAAEETNGSQPGTVVPVADQTDVTVDDTTYDNTVTGSGKLTTLVFPTDTVAVALAIAGDDFPRVLLLSDAEDGFVYIGDGTSDPYNGPHIRLSVGNLALNSGGTGLSIGEADANWGAQTKTGGSGLNLGGNGTFNAVNGDPNGNLPGNLNDLLFRNDAPDVNHYLYRCTTAGDSSSVVWTPIGGLV